MRHALSTHSAAPSLCHTQCPVRRRSAALASRQRLHPPLSRKYFDAIAITFVTDGLAYQDESLITHADGCVGQLFEPPRDGCGCHRSQWLVASGALECGEHFARILRWRHAAIGFEILGNVAGFEDPTPFREQHGEKRREPRAFFIPFFARQEHFPE